MMYGYARVSTLGQDHAEQVAELKAAGAVHVFAENASGAARRKRPQLAIALAALKPGDVLAVVRVSRLARNTRDALNLLAAIDAEGAAFRSLREEWADTTTANGRFMVSIMSAWAELEREMILERTAEGRAFARGKGVRLGRPPLLTARQVEFIRASRAETPPKSIGELQALLKVSRATITRAANATYQAAMPPTPPARQLDLEDLLTQTQA